MKGFERQNQLLSLCGLNCGLCPMLLSKNCPGCGGGKGNQPCFIARCSMNREGVEYCFQCAQYPCEKYDHIDEYDSFVTHRRQKADLEKAGRLGIEAYNAEQAEKAEILNTLLSGYNDGRRKTLFCLAVNLLDINDLREVLKKLEKRSVVASLPLKEKAELAAGLLKAAALENHIELKIRKKI